MVKKLSLAIIILTLILITLDNLPNKALSLEINLAPPFNDKNEFIYTKNADEKHSISISTGILRSYIKAEKGIGTLISEGETTLTLIKKWKPLFNGEIYKIEIKYTLKGLMKVQAYAKPNTLAAISKILLKVKFQGKDLNIQSKEIKAYGTETKEYKYNIENSIKQFNTKIEVQRNNEITIKVILYTKAEAGGSIEDTSIAKTDFYNGNYKAKISIKIYYKEKTSIQAEASPSKAYWGETITISGKLLADTHPLPNKPLKIYFEKQLISTITTNNDGTFTYTYKIPKGITPGLKNFEIKFEGDSNYLPSTKKIEITIPTFNLYISPNSLKIPVKSNGYSDIKVIAVNSYDKEVEIKITNIPSWIKYRVIGSAKGKPPLTPIIEIKPQKEGRATIKITAIGQDGQIKTKNLYIKSYNEPTFKITVKPENQAIMQGKPAYYNITVESINNYQGKITLTLMGETHFNYTITNNPIKLTSTNIKVVTKLIINTTEKTIPKTYQLYIEGKDETKTIKSNKFSLTIIEKPKATFQLKITPKNQTIIAGEKAKYIATLISINNFKGEITLNITNQPPYSQIMLSQNPITLNPNETKQIEITIITNEKTPQNIYNLTITAKSNQEEKQDNFYLTITNYPAKIKLYYINWATKKSYQENTYLPLEAVKIIVNYTPNTPITIILPKQITYPTINSTIKLATNNTGIAATIFIIKGPTCPTGTYNITIKNEEQEIIGIAKITVDIPQITYKIINSYTYSKIIFQLKWKNNNSTIINREKTIDIKLKINNKTITSKPINKTGITEIILSTNQLNQTYIQATPYYAESNIPIMKNNTHPIITKIKVKYLIINLIKTRCINFNYKLKIQAYYKKERKPAKNITIQLLILDRNERIIKTIQNTTNNNGIAILQTNIPFTREFQAKILCKDNSQKWVTSTKYMNTKISIEKINTLIHIKTINKAIIVQLCTQCQLMDLNSQLKITIYNNLNQPIQKLSIPITLKHGEIIKIPLTSLTKPYKIHVQAIFNDQIIGEEIINLNRG